MRVEVKTYKCGDRSPDGSLDYGLHLLDCKEYESDHAEGNLLKIQVAGEGVCPADMWELLVDCFSSRAIECANSLYNVKYVSRKCNLIVVEMCDLAGYTCVCGCDFGPSQVIYRNKDINYNDMLTFKDIRRAVLAYDNWKWYDPRLEEK